MNNLFEDNKNAIDTTLSMTENEYVVVLEQLGFEKVGQFEIDRSKRKYKERSGRDTEFFNVYARQDGLIISYDTYDFGYPGSEPVRNGAKIAYARDYVPGTDFGYEAGGVSDAREDLIKKVKILSDAPVSQEPPYGGMSVFRCEQDFSSAHEGGAPRFSQEQSDKVEQIQQERFDAMPPWVKNMVLFQERKPKAEPKGSQPSVS